MLSRAKILLTPKWLDRFEQCVLVVVFSALVVRLWPTSWDWDSWSYVLLLVSEGAVVLLVLLRRSTQSISVRWQDWVIGFAGTFLALGVAGGGPVLSILGGPLMLIGMCIHIGAKFSLWRSFGVVAANRGVQRQGLYRFVRHPMYAGYVLTHIGFLLVAPSLWNLAIYAAVWALLLLRIQAEERVLRADPEYRALCAAVPFRLAPGIY